MKVKLVAGLLGAAAFCAFAAGDATAQGSKRVTVAVMDFEYGTVDNWWGQYDIGKGMADQVVDALPPDRADQPLRVAIFAKASQAQSACRECPWRKGGG